MASDKNKIVENYVLEELRCINPDQSTLHDIKAKSGPRSTASSKKISRSKGSNTPLLKQIYLWGVFQLRGGTSGVTRTFCVRVKVYAFSEHPETSYL
jgi:hypothetical protein